MSRFPLFPTVSRFVALAFLLALAAMLHADEAPATNAPVSMARWILSERESTAPHDWGLDVSRAFERFDGLQLGLGAVDVLDGIQLGIVNGFGPPGDALWLPLVNARF